MQQSFRNASNTVEDYEAWHHGRPVRRQWLKTGNSDSEISDVPPFSAWTAHEIREPYHRILERKVTKTTKGWERARIEQTDRGGKAAPSISMEDVRPGPRSRSPAKRGDLYPMRFIFLCVSTAAKKRFLCRYISKIPNLSWQSRAVQQGPPARRAQRALSVNTVRPYFE